ncbi:MAG: hypothetical protein QOG76_3050, partial [Pseudonocardiales bacterium]|nr:hypothetical protein [Pseudonocardiales bacterium]
MDAAIQSTAMGLFFNQGEVCAAGTRVLVHRSLYDQVVDGLAAAAKAQVLGDPFDSATTMGALINAGQRDRVLGYIEAGRDEGATLVAGGGRPDGPGYFVEPTIFAGVDNDMTIAREEIFGPVGSVIPFDDPDDAIRLANATAYGLAATIWTRDVSQAHLLARKVRAGAVWVNGWGAIDPALPWGGMKTSGIGRELGWSGILANTEEKTVTIVLCPDQSAPVADRPGRQPGRGGAAGNPGSRRVEQPPAGTPATMSVSQDSVPTPPRPLPTPPPTPGPMPTPPPGPMPTPPPGPMPTPPPGPVPTPPPMPDP